MLRNTRSFEKNSFIRFLRLSQVRSLFASEYEQAQTAYERYINCIQRLFRPGKLSPADTLHMMAKLRIKLIAIQEEPVKVAPEMESLLRAAIALTNFEIKMVWLKVSHPAVMDCSKKVALPKSPIYLAEQFTPTDLMEIVTSMGTRSRTMSRWFTGFFGYVRRKFLVDVQCSDKQSQSV